MICLGFSLLQSEALSAYAFLCRSMGQLGFSAFLDEKNSQADRDIIKQA